MKKVIRNLFLFFASLPSVSARTSSDYVVEEILQKGQEIFTPIFEILLGTSSYDDFFFAKILFFLLLFVVIFAILKKVELFKKTEKFNFLIAVIISLLAIRYISEEGFFAGILLPYTTLGLAIITAIPFIIYFWFVHTGMKGSFGRRMAWIFYGIIFISLWISRSSELSTELNWIYILGLIALVVTFSFDKSIHKYFGTAKASKLKRRFVLKRIADIEADLSRYRMIVDPSDETRGVIRKLEKNYRDALGEL
tara:strand:+ start:902 stop:1657 length:756 start_codon:yes stop_codon:yes gene_type:complete